MRKKRRRNLSLRPTSRSPGSRWILNQVQDDRRWTRLIASFCATTFGVVILLGLALAYPSISPPVQEQGVTFAEPHTTGIGLDWKQAYDAILSDLGVKRLRLIAYWNVIEPEDDVFSFSDLDYQMDEAARHGASVILTVGRKVPRWPECHEPAWVGSSTEREKQQKILEMLPVVIERYKDHPALRMWQLENEPLLDFGICPPADLEFLRAEEDLLRRLDPDHPILITDSGELNSWIPAAAFGDTIGTTAYRTVFSERTQTLFFYDYIFPAWAYRLKSRYIDWLFDKPVIIIELQGEPWGSKPLLELDAAEREASFSVKRFQELAHFARRTQLPEAYWWGVEYWYWEQEIHDNPVYWEYAKNQVFN